MVHLVQDDGAVEATALQGGQVERVIQEALARTQVPGFAVVVEVFGVGQRDIVTQQIEGLGQLLLHPGQLAGLEDVGRVHDHLDRGRPHRVEQLTGPRGRVGDVVDFGLEGQGHPVLSGGLGRRLHDLDQIGHGLRAGVVRVTPPHDVLAAARAQGHHGGAQGVAVPDQLAQVTEVGPAARPVGMDHVERPVHRGHDDAPLGQLPADVLTQAGAQVLAQDVQPALKRVPQRNRWHRRAELELDGLDPVAGHGVQRPFQAGALELAGQNP